MMRLWIDDTREPPDDSWVVARKVEPAIRLIAHGWWDEISLDHDIENRPDDETFLGVAYYIGALYSGDMHNVAPKVTIHSINPVGAKEMQQVLKDNGIEAQYVPYGLPYKGKDEKAESPKQ